MRVERYALLVTAIVLCSVPLAAQSRAGLVSSIPTDPTEFGSLRLDPFEAVAPPAGEWTLLLAASYFNQWNGTWHTRRVHEGFGRAGEPIGDDELRALEEGFPDDDIYRVDVEGSRVDLLVAGGFGNGLSFQARVPWIRIGAPAWDGAAEAFHDAIPAVDHYVRELFPRGETFVYVRGQGRSVVRREELARSGPGDVALSLGIPLRNGSRSTQRLALTVEAPTGKEDSLHGSGGWDAGLRWFYTRSGERNDLLFGAGYTRHDPAGSFLGFPRRGTVHLSGDWIRALSPRTFLHAAARIDSSPLAGLTDTNLGEPVLFYRFGAQWRARGNHWIVADLGEEIAPQMGVDTDFSLHVGWALRSPESRVPGARH